MALQGSADACLYRAKHLGRDRVVSRHPAEMTCQEVRFIPVRFKDAYGPVGAWFLLFKSRATNSAGGDYMVERKADLENWTATRPEAKKWEERWLAK